VSNMLESTYHALHSSFRATLQVADKLSQMKKYFFSFISTLATFRTLRSIILFLRRKLLDRGAEREDLYDVWEGQNPFPQPPPLEPSNGGFNWPLVAYAGLVLLGPYFIWKFSSPASSTSEEDNGWATGKEEHIVAVAEHAFQAEAKEELTIQAGQELRVAPQRQQPHIRGWLLVATSTDNLPDIGLVPANRIKLIGRRFPKGTPDLVPS